MELGGIKGVKRRGVEGSGEAVPCERQTGMLDGQETTNSNEEIPEYSTADVLMKDSLKKITCSNHAK